MKMLPFCSGLLDPFAPLETGTDISGLLGVAWTKTWGPIARAVAIGVP